MVKLGKILIPVVAAASIFVGCSAAATTNSSTQSVNAPTLKETVGNVVTKPPIVNDDRVDYVMDILTNNLTDTIVKADRENKIFVLTLNEDLTPVFVLASHGNGAAIKTVEEFFESVRGLSSGVYEGCEFSLAIANPANPDNFIYAAYDGIEIYSYLE